MTCRHQGRRNLVRAAYDNSGYEDGTHLKEMYERYERERLRGIRLKDEAHSWRTIVRQEIDRIKRGLRT